MRVEVVIGVVKQHQKDHHKFLSHSLRRNRKSRGRGGGRLGVGVGVGVGVKNRRNEILQIQQCTNNENREEFYKIEYTSGRKNCRRRRRRKKDLEGELPWKKYQ
jgi:hypothetical protein